MDLEAASVRMFASEVGAHPRPNLFSASCASAAIHTLALLILLNLGLFQTVSFVAQPHRLLVPLVSTPLVVAPATFRPLTLLATPKSKSENEAVSRAQLELLIPKFVAPTLPSSAVKTATSPRLPILSPATVTGRFSGAAALAPTIRDPRQVQTGGFGDPNGVGGKGQADTRPTIARLGSFDLPPGPGAGNGTGGASGIKRVVTTSFGRAVEVYPAAAPAAPRPTIRPAGFPEIATATAVPPSRDDSAVPARTTPAEILSKPVPNYTAEARAMKLEGEVQVQVLFPASGRPKALRIIRGLGHGLDEAATRAVEGIEFQPAHQDGRPVDSTVVIFVVFQLT